MARIDAHYLEDPSPLRLTGDRPETSYHPATEEVSSLGGDHGSPFQAWAQLEAFQQPTRNSAGRLLRWRWEIAISLRSSTPIRVASSPQSAFVGKPQAEKIKISWLGRKLCKDNILVERLWRYCHGRPHSSLGGRTHHEVYTETEPRSSRPRLTI
jgi:putative transposase